jgi:UDP-N-acetyl-2-amino-2-deoxyglucuronate dehydrogenase
MKNFALIGAAGFIAPRHMKAIKETSNRLVAALDKSDSVGIIDSYFPEADFFTEFERFDRHIEKLRRTNDERRVNYLSIASPNYLHDAHIRFALRVDAEAICEKPLVLNPWNVEALREIEIESGRRISTILQLRLHPAIQDLKRKVSISSSSRKYEVDLTYITGRGRWYYYSWKGDESKSGGIATNIGIHFFDALIWVFGKVKSNFVHLKDPDRNAGFLELERARVRWYLSLSFVDLPEEIKRAGKSSHRCLVIDGEPLEFSEGLADLHTLSYREILAGRGYGLDDSFSAIEAVHQIRHAIPAPSHGEIHPLALSRQKK